MISLIMPLRARMHIKGRLPAEYIYRDLTTVRWSVSPYCVARSTTVSLVEHHYLVSGLDIHTISTGKGYHDDRRNHVNVWQYGKFFYASLRKPWPKWQSNVQWQYVVSNTVLGKSRFTTKTVCVVTFIKVYWRVSYGYIKHGWRCLAGTGRSSSTSEVCRHRKNKKSPGRRVLIPL